MITNVVKISMLVGFLIFIRLLQSLLCFVSDTVVRRVYLTRTVISHVCLSSCVCFQRVDNDNIVGRIEQRRWSLIIMRCCRLIPEIVIPRVDGMAHAAPISVFHHCAIFELCVPAYSSSLALCPNVSTIRFGTDATDAAAADTISFTFLPTDGAISPPETSAHE